MHREYTLEEWQAASTQPPLPTDLPDWLEPLVTALREGDIHDYFPDGARRVPDTHSTDTHRAEDSDAHSTERPLRHSAVLVLISHQKKLLLTRRAATMRQHSGQIAFPGGAREAHDPSPIHTALREANEETGLRSEHVTPLALMQPLYIHRSHFAVTPVLAYWEETHPVFPASTENDWVDTVDLDFLTSAQQRLRVELGPWNGPAFRIEDKIMWGFTADVVDAVLHRAGWEQTWDTGRTLPLLDLIQEV